MATLKVYTYPDPILAKKAETISDQEILSEEIQTLAQNMLETMYKAPGIGLAANQVGVLKRIIVMDTRARTKEGEVIEEELSEFEKKIQWPLVLINPEIIKKEGAIEYEEGCLSVPGYYEMVKRAGFVKVRAKNLKAEVFEFEADDLLGVCVQHEIDHLNGVVFVERLTPIKRTMIRNKIKKYGYSDPVEEKSVSNS